MPTAPPGVGALRGTEPFPRRPAARSPNAQLRRNLGHATRTIRAKRAAVVGEVPDWEELRLAGQAIKAATMARLDEHLERLEREVTARGGARALGPRRRRGQPHRHRDSCAATGAREVVKVKSMVTQEIGLNEALDRGRHHRAWRPTSPS